MTITIDPNELKSGDRVVVTDRHDIEGGAITGIDPYLPSGEIVTINEVSRHREDCSSGTLVTLVGHEAEYDLGWFDPLPEESLHGTLLVDDSGYSESWLYSATSDSWFDFDQEDLENGRISILDRVEPSDFPGFDEGVDAIIFGHGIKPTEDEKAPMTVERPLIDFSVDRYATAREYARRHRSKVNKTRTNLDLQSVADGSKVDAYSLNESLLDAMRGATTRAGQSSIRRQHAKEIAHLGHIVQAVLENHADRLPVYEPGERSPALEQAKAELARAIARAEEQEERGDSYAEQVDHLNQKVADLTEALTKAEADASEEGQRAIAAEAEVERLKLQVIEVLDGERRVRGMLTGAREVAADVTSERDRLKAALDYVLERMALEARERALGYLDGITEATS